MTALYQNDYMDYFPYMLFLPAGEGAPLYSWVANTLLYSGKLGATLDEVAMYYPVPANTNFLEQKNRFKSLACPENPQLWVEKGLHQSYATNYVCNFSVMGINYSATERRSLRVTQLKKTATTFIQSDGKFDRASPTANIDNTWYTKAGAGDAIGYIHSLTANAQYADGHVSNFPRQSIAPFGYHSTKIVIGGALSAATDFLFE